MNTEHRVPATALADLPPEVAANILAQESPETIHSTLDALPNDIAMDIAAHLASATRRDEQETTSHDNLSGIEGTIGQLMINVFGILAPEDTVASALDYIVRTDPSITITYIYVTDGDDKLLGVVAMRDLLLARPGQTLEQTMTPDPFAFTPDVEMPEAVNAALSQRHRLYPVTDKEGTLLGLVYGWKLFEYVATEISAQAGSMVGVDKEERISTPILESLRMRHPWLQINLLTAFAAAFVVGMFEDTIAQIVVLAVFLPVLAGQSGNTGCQALAITLRSMTLGELDNISISRVLRKEIILGAMNGFFVGLVAALAMWIYAGISGAEDAATLALVVLVAMVGACVGSGIFGVLVPVTLKRFGADPAMASSIFLTTFTDILGMGLMLFLATSLLM